MKTCYTIPVGNSCAIADLTDYYHLGKMITRINVPRRHRGCGLGSRLLQEILDDADREGVDLHLEVVPSDGLGARELEAWYVRNGFSMWKGVMRRRPVDRDMRSLEERLKRRGYDLEELEKDNPYNGIGG